MAQALDKKKREASRVAALVRQRPRLLVVGLLVLCLVVAAAVLGVRAASAGQQTLIERSGADVSGADVPDQEEAKAAAAEAETIVVDVSGAVVNPGVYELTDGARVSDAIEAAGGLSEDADVSILNRASKVSDGMKVTVPTQGEQASSAGGGDTRTAASSQSAAQASGLVNINTATVDELQALSGVGPSTAQAIVDDREKNGLFASAEDLMRVSGIGEKKFAKIKDSICV